jgi:hypothetical protein
MRCSWKQLDSGPIVALVIVSEWELSFLEAAEFWSRVTMELPVGLYTVITRTENPALAQYTLRLMGLPGQPEMGLG